MANNGISRRGFVKLQLYGGAWMALGGASTVACRRNPGREIGKRMLILGLDGMDPSIVARMMAEGKLPAFARVARDGFFGPLGTSSPPQSPVAWASFITGCNPGGHGLFDFIHRDPSTYLPYLSTSHAEGPEKTITIGDWVIPLSSGTTENLRRGRAFWDYLEDHEIPATVFKMPSNFPPSETKQRTFSGMGTPDILGTYGTFSYYTDDPVELKPDLGGGRVIPVTPQNDVIRTTLDGPPNTMREGAPTVSLDLEVYRDPERRLAKIVIDGEEILLEQGQWSSWVRVAFPIVPTQSVRGICRFYLKQVHPNFRLYVSPIQIDPADPAQPISTPESYSKELAEKFGPFHTKGLPADTKALDNDVLNEGEFLEQDDHILAERLAIFDYELAQFDSGLLFFYVSSPDQRTHMFWRLMDPAHPAHDAKLAAKYGDTVERTYQQMDRLLAKALTRVDEHTMLMVLSDHGFSPYYRSFHLNSWLHDNGYLHLIDSWSRGEREFLQNVDWSRTKAYALGLNGLYLNTEGREGRGIVPTATRDDLTLELARKLEAERDPLTGEPVIRRAVRSRQAFSGPHIDVGPDIVVGYNRGYRSSWQTALGKVPRGLFENNMNKWSGDHCMASDFLSGIFFSNRPVAGEGAALTDLTATILDYFDIPVPSTMDGRSVLIKA